MINNSFFKVTEMKQVCHYYNLSPILLISGDKGISADNVQNAVDAIDSIEANSQEKANMRINLCRPVLN